MNHPYELLADLVDGTLDEDTLAGVQAHLDACARCRADVERARRGRRAAGSLPVAETPADLHERVVAAAGGGRGGAPRWYRWAGAAAAAAVVLAIAIALPDVGRDDGRMRAGTDSVALDSSAGAEGGGEAARAEDAGGGPAYSILDRDFDQTALQDLAEQASADAREAQVPAPLPQEALAADTAIRDADRCVREAFDGQPTGELARVIQATFDGRGAYLVVYREGPGAGQPPDTIAVYAASRDGCQLLSFASSRI